MGARCLPRQRQRLQVNHGASKILELRAPHSCRCIATAEADLPISAHGTEKEKMERLAISIPKEKENQIYFWDSNFIDSVKI